jgi:hypothetical protein
MPRRHDDDDSPFDARGVLKDGRSIRVEMLAMDAGDGDEDLISSRSKHKRRKVQQRDPKGREAGTYEEEEDAVIETDMAPMIVDAFGLSDGLSRPGSRHLLAGRKTLDHVQQVTRECNVRDAYAESVRSATDAWRGGADDRTIPVKRQTSDATADSWLDLQEWTAAVSRGQR